ncbi:MAG: EAL domain-containing protein [Aeromonadaceae bacterium]
MKLTNQLVGLLCLCVVGSVTLLLVVASFSFDALTSHNQQLELQAVVDIIEEEALHNPDAPILQAWIPPILEANGVKEVMVYLGEVPIFYYYDEHYQDVEHRLRPIVLSGRHTPSLRVNFSVLPPILTFEYMLRPFLYLLIGLALVTVGLWWAMSWVRRQLRGVELLAERGLRLLQGQSHRLSHDFRDEWPEPVSRALTLLQSELEDAKKERSRFDTFIRRNVFIDKELAIGNRIFFDNRLEAAIKDAESSTGAILLVELEAVESVSQREGSERGQALLLECSHYLNQHVQRFHGGVLARYAGNVLALLIPNLTKQETLTTTEQLLRSLDRLPLPTYLDLEQSLYIGVVCYQPGEQLMQLEEQAEQALRSARLQQERGYFLYDKPLRTEATDKGTVRWRTRLERLFSGKQLHYQLQVAMAGDPERPILQELLALLPDEQGRLLSATQFLVMVEKSGMQLPFDRLMTQQALTLLPKAERQKLPIAINLHPQTLLDREYRHWLLMQLLRLGKRKAAYLVIELNEAQLCRYQPQLRLPLRELRLMGVRLSVDHVGQEVSSIHYITEFEVRYLKLHPSLIRDIRHRPLNQMAIRSLVGGSASGDAQVIAVGVETVDEWQVLQSLGVTGAQGFLFGQPELVAT